MIELGKEIRVIYTGKGCHWRIRPVSMPVIVYSYYKENDMGYEPPGVLYNAKYGDTNFDIMSKYYFRITPDPHDPNPNTKRIAAYVIDVSELWTKELAIFLLPTSVYSQMRGASGVTGESDWEIDKTGIGLQTRYTCKKIERTELSDAEKKVVSDTIENVSIIDALSKKVKVYTQKSYTAFERYDILDFDD